MLNLEISLNISMKERLISKNYTNVHRTTTCVIKVLTSFFTDSENKLNRNRQIILDGDVVGLKDKPKEMRVNECILPRW